MAPPLTLSLLCDKNEIFREKRIPRFPHFHSPTERQKERERERQKDNRSSLILVQHLAASSAIIYREILLKSLMDG